MARDLLLIAALTASAACSRDQPASPARADKAEAAKAAPAAPAAPPLASKPFYRVDAGPPPACTTGATCEVRLVLTALGDYHVNKDYPFKFIGEPAPAPALDGDPTFALDDAKRGTLTVRFKPTTPGPVTLAGVFKLSVCSDDTCEIEKPQLALSVAVR